MLRGKVAKRGGDICSCLMSQALDILGRKCEVACSALSKALARMLNPLAAALGKGYGATTVGEYWVAEAQTAVATHNKTNRACSH